MVICVVLGCSKRSGRDKDVSFYRLPKIIVRKGQRIEQLSRRRREGFISAISRADLTEKILSNDRICSRHFLSGKPASLEDELNPDWLPTQNLGNSKTRTDASKDRYDRMRRRDERQQQSHKAITSQDCHSVDVGTQTELTRQHTLLFKQELYQAQEKIRDLECLLKSSTQLYTEESTVHNNTFVKFYTGLPNGAVLKAVYEFIAPTESSKLSKLTPFQELMMTLIKLRLNLSMQDLAY